MRNKAPKRRYTRRRLSVVDRGCGLGTVRGSSATFDRKPHLLKTADTSEICGIHCIALAPFTCLRGLQTLQGATLARRPRLSMTSAVPTRPESTQSQIGSCHDIGLPLH
ncbi:hypothetical protein M3J09_001196 [Ascochyta lentis]